MVLAGDTDELYVRYRNVNSMCILHIQEQIQGGRSVPVVYVWVFHNAVFQINKRAKHIFYV